MTVNDMLEQFEIQGWLRIQSWNEEAGDMDVYYDNLHDNDLINRDYEWLDRDIAYMYPSTTYNENDIEVPQIVIEIKIY